jgi:hypothetical protein
MANALALNSLVQLRVWTYMATSFQAAVNTSWYLVTSIGASPATDQDVADIMSTNISAPMRLLLNNLAQYNGCQAIIHSPVPPNPATNVPANSVIGAGAGAGGAVPLPKQSCGIIKFTTGSPGPGGRGRWYTPFPPQAGDSGFSTVSPAYQVLLQNLAAVVGITVTIATGGRSAVLQRVIRHGINKLGIYPPPSPVLAFVQDAIWATQKRRGSFGRQNFPPI